MKLVLRLTEKPKYKDPKFSKLRVKWENVSLEFSDYRYGQSYETLPDEDKEIIRQALTSDNSVLTVFDDNWLDLKAEFVDLY